ncbi:hypothetical protein D3C81_1971780 [compost metagenome]
MVAQGRGRDPKLLLQLAHRQSLLTRLDQVFEDKQAGGMTQLLQRLGNLFQLHHASLRLDRYFDNTRNILITSIFRIF